MRLTLVTLLLTATLTTVFGQQLPKRYIFVEHFTNTRCGSCALHNPGLKQRIDDNPGQVHHISVHSEIPYQACEFYQHNTVDNNYRKDIYGVFGTPTTFTQGVAERFGGGILLQEHIDSLNDEVSPIRIVVEEELVAGVNNIDIEVETHAALNNDKLKLYAAVVEQRVNYNAPNGETLHYNVFREMLPANEGEPYSPAPVGSSVSFNYSVAIDSVWDPAEVYVVAFIQDTTTNEVINSGTKFDDEQQTVSALEPNAVNTLHIYPNPANNVLTLQVKEGQQETFYEMTDIHGKAVLSGHFTGAGHTINTAALPTGMYILRLTDGGNTVGTRKVLIAR